jgi:hypothetical protein
MTKKKVVKKQIPKWQRKRNARLRLYARVVRATRKELAAAGVTTDYKTARAFTSEFIYGEYRGSDTPSKIKITEIRKYAKGIIEEQLGIAPTPPPPRFEFIDPRIINEVDVDGVNYWEINDFLTGAGDTNILQSRALQGANQGKNLRFEVIADIEDRTGELTLLEYDGVDSGVLNIIERIRRVTNNGSGPYFSGTVGKREGFTDESDPNTYILQFILYINDEPVVSPDETVTPLPRAAMTQAEIEEFQRQRRLKLDKKDEIDKKKEEIARAKARKTAVRPTKKKKVKEPEPTPAAEPKKAKKTRGDRVLELNEQKLKELDMLRKDYDDGILTKREYKKDRQRIMEQYEEALKKLKMGGVV